MLIDGKLIAQKILDQVREDVSRLPFQPVFCDVIVGNNPLSLRFVDIKGRAAHRVGIKFEKIVLPGSIKQEDLANYIHELGNKNDLCGLIIQLPLPSQINRTVILDAIDPVLDVDSLGSLNLNKFYADEAVLYPPTASAIMAVLASTNQDFSGKCALIIGKGELVGRPVAHLLEHKVAELLVIDNKTKNIQSLFGRADLVISGVGKPGLVFGKDLKEGAVVIDAGTSEMNGGIVGDVDLVSVRDKASFFAAVPGGVGPVTVAKLLANVAQVAKIKAKEYI